MLRKPFVAVILSSLYLAIYIAFFYSGNFNVVFKMFLAAPVVLAWLAYTVIRFGKFDGRELGENEEWGYEDKQPGAGLKFNDN